MSRVEEEKMAVEWFANRMLDKLRQNGHKGHWKDMPLIESYKLMLDECAELLQEIESGNKVEAILEAADVANFAMMIADNCARILGGEREE